MFHSKLRSVLPRLHRTASRCFSFSLASPRSLNDIVKLDALQALESNKIEDIWTNYHSDPKLSAVGHVLTPDHHSLIMERAKSCPMFVFPVFKDADNYYSLVSQFQDRLFFLTYLEDYRTNPTTAQPYMSIALFDELKETKGLCFSRADYLPSVSRSEAGRILDLVSQCYTNDEGFKHIHAFNKTPEKFSFPDSVEYLKNV